MRLVLLLLLFAGVTMVMANELVAARTQPRIVYRYLPRDLDTYLREQPSASATFKSMFERDDALAWRY
jgi:hypothetical protein